VDNDFAKIIDVARAARARSYSPYSGFPVGASIEVGSGKIFAGTNIENISLGLTICAERAAVGAAVTAGERDLQRLALISDSAAPIVPCGACRQVLAEFNPRLQIVSVTLAGKRRIESLHELFPWPKRGILDHAES
jgi:cytidine deaminase